MTDQATQERPVVLYGADGHPLPAKTKSLVGLHAVDSYLQALSSVQRSPTARARDPILSHPWVCAAATMTSTVSTQAPYQVWRETPEFEAERERLSLKRGEVYVPRSGDRRRAVQRHLYGSPFQRIMSRAIQPEYDHPLYSLFLRPNPYQDGSQLFQFTTLWLVGRGEVYWVLTGENGERLVPGEVPAQLWPVSPDLFTPLLERHDHGSLVGWKYYPPDWMPDAAGSGRYQYVELDLHEVIQFKFSSPTTLLRGLSKLTPLAASIELDMMLDTYERTLLKNQGVPRGLLTYDGDLSQEAQAAYLAKHREQHEGLNAAGRTLLLANGFKYAPLALPPADLQGRERRDATREEVLANLATPPSVLGVTDFLNYATQLGQDNNFWSKSILPMQHMMEVAIDAGIFHSQPDNVLGGFDYRGVEAMRAGISEKIDMAARLTEEKLHCPPRVAFMVVGLEVPTYPHDNVALVGPLVQTLDSALAIDEPESAASPVTTPPPVPEDGGNGEDGEDSQDAQVWSYAKASKPTKLKRWRAFVKLEAVLEGKLRRGYRDWVAVTRAETLKKLDALARKKAPELDLTVVLPDIKALQASLKARSRPTYASTLEATFNFTLGELGGVPTFEADHELLLDVLERREALLVGGPPVTLLKKLNKTLLAGVQAAESLQQIRVRVAEVFDLASSSAQALGVARTHTAGLMNGVRDEMFGLQGLEDFSWSNAGDELVRTSHVDFGKSGTHKRGFNYMSLVPNGTGVLAFPGDPRAPVGQRQNCRCIVTPL